MSDEPHITNAQHPAEAAPGGAAGEEVGEVSAASEVLRLKLDKFEGPFEVLLYLIRSQEIDIFDIPIVKVTEQYLSFLEMMEGENLDIAGEFLVMAATLIQIKSKMILPIETVDEEEEELEEEDPRLELVEKLLEYRKFRDLARRLGDLGETQMNRYGRAVKPKIERAEEEEYFEVSLYDLARALRSILRFITDRAIHEIAGEEASVEEKIDVISNWLAERESVTWTELFRACKTRVEVVCCLLAILELCRMGRIRAHQHRAFGDIRIFARPDAPEPSAGGGADVVAAA
ncbi:MAG TPA: segregation/condensation protein A [Candidatus Hydrogenedentes bacterium]|nr:segregation/condensation protein A [Candidatus Hydrogenedentota bacterium]